MISKIARFLAEQQPATPCLVLDVDRVADNFRALRHALPLAQIYYAVKANPAAPVLERLAVLGSSFDAAGAEEIDACLAAGAAPARSASAIPSRRCPRSAAPMRPACRCSPSILPRNWTSSPAMRRAAASIAASWSRTPAPTGRCRASSAPRSRARATSWLRAADLGLDPYGLSFHVGSQQTDTASYEAAIGRVAMLFTDLREAGVNLRMVNLGGGFPVRYRDEVPAIDAFGNAIMGAMTRHFGNALPEMMIEPGRFIVGDAGVVSAEVVLVSRRAKGDPVRWVYLDIGRFGGLAETEGEAIKYRITTPARRQRGGAGGDCRADLRRRGHPV